jgi:hypothetical protein
VSTPTDVLDLLDAWHSGALFTTDRTVAPERLMPDLVNPDVTYVGVGIPFNGYCPCTDVAGGVEPSSIGRKPSGLWSRTFIVRYADGISLVLNVNTGASSPTAELDALEATLHDLVVAAS